MVETDRQMGNNKIDAKANKREQQVNACMTNEMDASDVLEIINEDKPHQQPEIGQTAEEENEEWHKLVWLHEHVKVTQQPGVIRIGHKERTDECHQPRFLPH